MRIAILTSGGDAPGMNAAIRAVVRAGSQRNWDVVGVLEGFRGLMAGDFQPLDSRAVGGIMQLGGTMLRSARAPEFSGAVGQEAALQQLAQRNIDGLVVVGGNGSQRGSLALSRLGFPVVGLASTIDNDLWGVDVSLGVDTALNVVLESLDRIRSTASSHGRIFLVEVMGRDCGYLALNAGIAGGAEIIAIPETDSDELDLMVELRDAFDRKGYAVGVVAEGWRGGAAGLARAFAEAQLDDNAPRVRLTILGHVQRGGTPTYADRMLGTRLGAAAVACLAHGEHGVLLGSHEGRLRALTLEQVGSRQKDLDAELLLIAQTLRD
ncbi:MAG: ATP-dependent 6-phosphofructokinase [Anaerolineae bacterium]|nr:6-phosphofructokinase [Ardenticatenia bacterium]HQZ70270.1 ATP-dependent 6-phosphofructokinase [Anaerolineae bacterium]